VVTFLNFLNVFFENPKNDFLRFYEMLHTFSQTLVVSCHMMLSEWGFVNSVFRLPWHISPIITLLDIVGSWYIFVAGSFINIIFSTAPGVYIVHGKLGCSSWKKTPVYLSVPV